MKSIGLGLVLGAALFAWPVAGALAASDHTAISNDGRGLSSSGNAIGSPVSGSPVSRSFEGRSGSPIGILKEKESKEDIWALWGLAPVTAPVGTESIIGKDQRKRIKRTKKYPFRAAVLITFSAGRCTGWLINKNTVATAGHCVYDPGAGFYNVSSFKIYPGRNGNKSPYGHCKAKRLYTVAGWRKSGKDDYDYGAIKLKCNIGKKVGWFGYFWQAASLKGKPTHITGYPGDKPLTLWRSKGKVSVSQTRRVFYKNDTTGGMSGSPVYYKKPGCGWCSMAIHAYGTYNGPPFSKNNHGTRITKSVFDNLSNWKNSK